MGESIVYPWDIELILGRTGYAPVAQQGGGLIDAEALLASTTIGEFYLT